MWTGIILLVLGLLSLALLVIALAHRRLDQEEARRVATLLAESQPPPGQASRRQELDGVPAPVQRYLSRVLPEGQDPIATVSLRQTGEFRLGDRTSPWKPMQASQHFVIHPPGFVWQARIQMAPLVQARVVDMYRRGEGSLQARLFSFLTVADARGAPEIDAGELMRYLAEAVWFPTALLPGQHVEWSPIDDGSARATVTHQGTCTSLVFQFNDRDEVERVHAEARFREVDGRYEPTPWTGHWRDYETRHGLLIPTAGEVVWHLPDGDLPYWRARLDDIDYTVEGARSPVCE